DGRLIASASSDRSAYLWDANRGELLRKLPHRNVVTCVCFHPGGKQLATGDAEGSVRLWDVSKFKELGSIRAQGSRLHAVAFSPDTQRLATAGSSDATVRLWDVEGGLELLELSGGGQCVAFSPDGKRIAAAALVRQVLLWDVRGRK